MDASDAPVMILASSSPRRRQLLTDAGYSFDVVDPPVGEPDDRHDKMLPSQQAEALAYFKVRSVWREWPNRRVLAADTVVAVGGQVLGKPTGPDDARRMLQKLSDGRHCVITGVAILDPPDQRLIASDMTYITMRQMSGEEIDDYIASGEWEGKAGAYAIQETADRFVTAVEGSFTNVVGLPMELVEQMLSELRRRPEAHHAML